MTPPSAGRPVRALSESGHLARYLDGVDFEIGSHDFFLLEFARLVDEGAATFENDAFSALVSESVRLHVNPNDRIRSAVAGRFRRAANGIEPRDRAVARDVVSAVEDLDFPLDSVGAVVSAYTHALLARVEEMAGRTDQSDSIAARGAISEWEAGECSFSDLRARLRELGAGALGAVADLLLDVPDDARKTQTALDLLEEWNHPVAARTLAFAISEPLLEESQEQRAISMVEKSWPSARPFILYRLRQHSHDDVGFRWLELLISTGESRAVDRILEELVAHANDPTLTEDLRVTVDLLGRSQDPGLEGKLVRFMTNAAAPPEALDLIEEWIVGSNFEGGIDESVTLANDGVPVLVAAGTDFLDFIGEHPDVGIDDAWQWWTAAYHESLDWQRYTDYAWTELERELDRELESMVRELMPSGRVDSQTVRPLVETARERRLLESDPPPLASILESRPSRNAWERECRRRELNDWYVRAAAAYDEGNVGRSIRILDALLGVEPDAPMATMLREIVRESEEGG